jgi:hypothetical protein
LPSVRLQEWSHKVIFAGVRATAISLFPRIPPLYAMPCQRCIHRLRHTV